VSSSAGGELGGRPPRKLAGLARGASGDKQTTENPGNGGALERVVERIVRLPEVLHGIRGACQRFREPKFQHDLRPPLGGWRLLQRTPQIRDRAVHGAPPRRRSGSLEQGVDDQGVTSARGQQHVGRHLLGASADGAQDVGRLGVLELAPGRRQILVDRVPNERVNERERQLPPQDVRADEPVRGLADLGLSEPRERRDRRQLGAIAEHGNRACDVDRLPGQTPEPAEHGSRDGAWPDVVDDADVIRGRLDAVGHQRREQLVEQQRVAAGCGVAGKDERLLGGWPKTSLHEFHDGCLAERIRADAHRGRNARYLVEQGLAAAELGWTQRAYEEDRQSLEPAGEVGDKSEGGHVAPVEVVDRYQRALGGDVGREPIETVERRERGVDGLLLRRLVERCEHRFRAGRRPGQHPVVHRRIGEERLEELPHRPEGELPLEYARAPGEHVKSLRRRPRFQRAEQPALADPGAAFDQRDLGAAGRDPSDERLERRELSLTLEKQGFRVRYVDAPTLR
jgi:hypothetical protein